MAATTASAARPSSLFYHRYSDPTISPSRFRESSHTRNLSSSPSTSNARDTTTHRMSVSIPPPPHDQPSELVRIAPARRSSHGDAPTEPPAAGLKYACASCIRGHRTSSCNHKDGSKGPLYPIRSKGRPPTQCEICRKKRKESGRHVRCDCTGKKTSSAATSAAATAHLPKKTVAPNSNVSILPRVDKTAAITKTVDCLNDPRPYKRSKISTQSSSTQSHISSLGHKDNDADAASDVSLQSSTHGNVLAPIHPPRSHHSWSLPSIHSAHEAPRDYEGRVSASQSNREAALPRYPRLSLSSLMNPCGCRSTGACTCCSDQRQRRSPVSPQQSTHGMDDCDPGNCSCAGDSCLQPWHSAATSATLAKPASSEAGSSQVATSACCSGKGATASAAPSIELLLQAVDMSTEFVPPPCGCGKNCRCARCLAKQDANSQQRPEAFNRAPSTITTSSVSPRTPPAALSDIPPAASMVSSIAPGCDDCAACDLALERPSGIGAVDSWMDNQRDLQRPSTNIPSPSKHRSPSAESRSHSASTSRRTSQAELHGIGQRGVSPLTVSVPTLHGGLLTSEAGNGSDNEVRAELVLVHPKCAACLEVVRSKGVGVLSSVPGSAKLAIC